jgi:hypothetical protein
MKRALILTCGIAVLSWVPSARSVTLDWTRQLGSSVNESAEGVSADALGNVYISGYTYGSLGGPSLGGLEAFLAKYDVGGNIQWTRQLGTSADDSSYGVSADGLGNAYVSGWTVGSLGGPNAGGQDAFLAKYDSAGNLQWTRQLGTSAGEASYAVSADGQGNVYITGETNGSLGGPFSGGNKDAFVAKYDFSGNLQWTRQFGNSSLVEARGVSTDGLGSIYITGHIVTSGNQDAFLRKYDALGNLQWMRQFGIPTGAEWSYEVSADQLGNVYISGQTTGNLAGPTPTPPGTWDGFVAKFDAVGSHLWTLQLGTSAVEVSTGVAADGLGNVYLSGFIDRTTAFEREAFVSKYDTSGNLQWTRQLGTSASDDSRAISADGLGNIYLSGSTGGSLGGPNAGSFDAFVAKYIDGPAGDYNGNDVIDAADYIVWRKNGGTETDYNTWRASFGNTALGPFGDFNSDAAIDAADYVAWRKGVATGAYTQDDYNTWRANFGAPAAGAAAVAQSAFPMPVPEPGTLALSAIAVASICGRRCSEHRKRYSLSSYSANSHQVTRIS